MTSEADELAALIKIVPHARLETEAGSSVVLLPQMRMRTPDGVETFDAVLCPRGHSGYVTRLLLDRRIASRSNLNWQEVTALGRQWHTWSWANVSADQPWVKILAEHMRCCA